MGMKKNARETKKRAPQKKSHFTNRQTGVDRFFPSFCAFAKKASKRFLFSRRFFQSRLERFRRARAVSRFTKPRNRRGNACNVGNRGTALFAQTDARFRADDGRVGRATPRSAARAGRVRAVRARAGPVPSPHVPSASIVANVSRSSCVAVSERRACAVFDRSVRRDPACFSRAFAIFCALKCARNARGGACERGGAITVGREATIAADWTHRSCDPAGACATARVGRRGSRGVTIRFFSQTAFRPTLLVRVRQNANAKKFARLDCRRGVLRSWNIKCRQSTPTRDARHVGVAGGVAGGVDAVACAVYTRLSSARVAVPRASPRPPSRPSRAHRARLGCRRRLGVLSRPAGRQGGAHARVVRGPASSRGA